MPPDNGSKSGAFHGIPPGQHGVRRRPDSPATRLQHGRDSCTVVSVIHWEVSHLVHVSERIDLRHYSNDSKAIA